MDYQEFAPSEQVEVIQKLCVIANAGLVGECEGEIHRRWREYACDLEKAPWHKRAVVSASRLAGRIFGGDWRLAAIVALLPESRQKIAQEVIDEFVGRVAEQRSSLSVHQTASTILAAERRRHGA